MLGLGPTAVRLIRTRIGTRIALGVIPDGRFLPFYLHGIISGRILLAHLKAKADESKQGLRFKPTGQAKTELVGVVNLSVRNNKLCFLLEIREPSERIDRAYYALPVGRRDGGNISKPQEVSELGDLSLKGLVLPEEVRATGESIFHAAARRNFDKTGISVQHQDIIGRIEFQAMQKDAKIVVFLADADYGQAFEEKDKTSEHFQWIPFDVLLRGNPGLNVERLLEERGLDTALIPSLKSGGLQELASWFREHSR